MIKKSEKVFQDLRRRVAHNLARLRMEQRLTFEELGKLSGLHWRHLQKIEAGEVNVTIDTITRLARGLGVDSHELLAKAPRGRSP